MLNLLNTILLMMGSYSNNVFKDPLSNKEEEICINKMLNGDEKSRTKLIEHNLRLVAHIAKKFDCPQNEFDDLISIGTIGLIKGIDSYKNDKNIKLTTYVAKCIQNEILMYYRSIKGNNISTISLDDNIGYDKDGNTISLMEVIKDNKEDISTYLQKKDNILLINTFLNKLSYREKEIIIKRFGLMNHKELTQKEIASEMHISRSYVSRIEKRALSKIIKELKKDKKND